MTISIASFKNTKFTNKLPNRHCVLKGRLISLRQDATHLHYKVTWPAWPPPTREDVKDEDDATEALLRSYFALSHSLTTLYAQWSLSDANFAKRAPAFTGIRILNQDAWETLISFICSSNNNISRISQMVLKLCKYYGPHVADVDGEPFHDFPGPEALAGPAVEQHLRDLGFGYRAKYIHETAGCIAQALGEKWLLKLRNPDVPALGPTRPSLEAAYGVEVSKEEELAEAVKEAVAKDPPTYKKAHEALLALPGVGPKVSDCVCLMGLGWGESVPIDTHVWQIAQRDYKFGGKGDAKTKTLSKAMYEAVGDHFRKIWGPQAGWAQSVLFTANLKSFSAQAAGVKKKEDEVKVEEESQEETVTTAKTVINPEKKRGKGVKVKVEESEEVVATKSAAKSRKRKAVGVEVIPKAEPDATVQTTTTRTLRSSKRIKSQV